MMNENEAEKLVRKKNRTTPRKKFAKTSATASGNLRKIEISKGYAKRVKTTLKIK
jgi:hypothetical protein